MQICRIQKRMKKKEKKWNERKKITWEHLYGLTIGWAWAYVQNSWMSPATCTVPSLCQLDFPKIWCIENILFYVTISTYMIFVFVWMKWGAHNRSVWMCSFVCPTYLYYSGLYAYYVSLSLHIIEVSGGCMHFSSLASSHHILLSMHTHTHTHSTLLHFLSFSVSLTHIHTRTLFFSFFFSFNMCVPSDTWRPTQISLGQEVSFHWYWEHNGIFEHFWIVELWLSANGISASGTSSSIRRNNNIKK